jgi:hypothetical protein
MPLDPARFEMIDDQMAEILRAKTPLERLKMAESMQRMARGLIRDKLASTISIGLPSTSSTRSRRESRMEHVDLLRNVADSF